ncbi:thiamine biosynthesis protein ThiS [Mangrovactinospora gilvigrisea]|uniref:Thiamine biosynthesis protein ThiS n=1 Tax=Mangrovactinospora gilvigrisea TaxID=1428644 RepID=A0A1J7BCC0_9ACTN|nr:sulfur carrier protein ThiS [Mangrovactinospora gilvigrisea]OIV36237.1 thiamine biosynthesis protein ThiS [Mangrovactinospora gilvigrisea]
MTVHINGEPTELPDDITLADAIARVTAAREGLAAAVNSTVVPRSAWPTTHLATGDRLELLTAVQGG